MQSLSSTTLRPRGTPVEFRAALHTNAQQEIRVTHQFQIVRRASVERKQGEEQVMLQFRLALLASKNSSDFRASL